MKKIIAAAAILLSASSLTGCAPLLVGAVAGAAVYHHECYRWVSTQYGLQRVWVCHGRHRR